MKFFSFLLSRSKKSKKIKRNRKNEPERMILTTHVIVLAEVTFSSSRSTFPALSMRDESSSESKSRSSA